MRKCLLAFLVLALPSAALAQEAESEEETCRILDSWEGVGEGSQTIMIVQETKQMFDAGDVIVTFINKDWSISDGDDLGVIKLSHSDGGWFEGLTLSTDNGFTIVSNFEHVSHVFDNVSGALQITRQGSVIDRLKMSDYMAWVRFKSCRNAWVREKEEAERKRKLEEDIPRDPFAGDK